MPNAAVIDQNGNVLNMIVATEGVDTIVGLTLKNMPSGSIVDQRWKWSGVVFVAPVVIEPKVEPDPKPIIDPAEPI